ncbi:hypothetical protein QQS21_003164 [Conoideocrella luteorostrata]|uniref:Uncharacterized protein n=1 Tax=Conoideocrella luteorostrata TaxID=1105319 RepID=A0AAJ0G2H4_9HYPO|nr:hypothetical protein QQS21_003164 [Conoideocrella luteorostrata]
MDAGEDDRRLRKRARKSRGKGLRTTTGCASHQPQASLAENTENQDSPPVAHQSQQNDALYNYSRHREDGLFATHEPLIETEGNDGFIYSPESISSETWSANFASIRWLDLLSTDAALADSNFSLAASPLFSSEQPRHARPPPPAAAAISTHASPALLNGQAQLPEDLDPEFERTTWQAVEDVVLSTHEVELFRHFTDCCASFLDVLDPCKPFSNYAIRLAIRNTGLMKAILALSAKHQFSGLDVDGATRRPQTGPYSDFEGEEWIRYYYETLQYVREALKYSSYSHSEELLATALVISAYEMLDESDGSGNWQRHLKGIFWIQRSQDVDGGCGGLRQAVWWAWLRQDIWAAFRVSRTCFSFWVPTKALHELDQNELADRSIYILSQAINYRANVQAAAASGVTTNHDCKVQVSKQRERLNAMMEQWKSCLGDEYKAFPVPNTPLDEVFTPIWIHPPRFGVALQAYSFAQILVTLHSVNPIAVGFTEYLKMQHTVSEAVNTICGIAMQLRDKGCQVLSAQCLYGAGLCVSEGKKRDKIISLMEECESHFRWAPMTTWRKDLRREWAKADGNEIDVDDG